ncbi:DUF6499 domain-containing protein [Novosphingobium sp.]|uniref:transcriptional regulator domain-containing protein n=1 Tax=Novosphingobium sp. TaxID=1874826 RepID=UPI0031D61A44
MPGTPQPGGAWPSPVPNDDGPVPQPDDLAGFAQEFLRRSPTYRREWQRLQRGGHAPAFHPDPSFEEMARPWGLCFSL